jgi:16S rRNA (uracil1498-N3)-methyltransferase
MFRMHSFHVSQKITGNSISIYEDEQLHHLRDVLRLKVGEKVIVFDSEGNEYLSTIAELNKKEALLTVKSKKAARPRKLKLAIACAIPKQAKMDEIIDKLTQLDVDVIIPMQTERVIVKLEGRQEERLERWRKIARSAAEQSHRNTLPLVTEIRNLPEVLVQSREYDLKLIPNLEGDRKSIKEIITGLKPTGIIALIGPEGDFTPQEVGRAKTSGFVPVSLGDSVLRVDTAAIAIASYLEFEFID